MEEALDLLSDRILDDDEIIFVSWAFTILVFCIVRVLINSDRIHEQFTILKPDHFFSSIFPLFPTVASTVGPVFVHVCHLRILVVPNTKTSSCEPSIQRCDRREHKLFTAYKLVFFQESHIKTGRAFAMCI